MNRLFIIGNGFDLAHGLKTKYSDFIDSFWSESMASLNHPSWEINNSMLHIKINFETVIYVIDKDKLCKEIKEVKDLLDWQNLADKYNKNYSDYNHSFISYSFYNEFFALLCSVKLEKWVDIEYEYYQQLKQISKITYKDSRQEKIKKLNEEFNQIKDLFEKYLQQNVDTKISSNFIIKGVFELLNVSEYRQQDEISKIVQEFPQEDRKNVKEENDKKKGLLYSDILKGIYQGKIKENTLLLNFNYTKLIDTYLYYNHLDSLLAHIQIHGKVGDSHNKINFGFGDEMDEDYKMIENLDENEFLRNFKSFGYLQNSNYKNLLDFIELGKFQVIIMGHSCGISDRTMLNTIFEHPNCRSIKPFYYQWKDEEGITHDNFTELVQNISRHFNKKKQMREKVVNKSLCQPLPQFKKE